MLQARVCADVYRENREKLFAIFAQLRRATLAKLRVKQLDQQT